MSAIKTDKWGRSVVFTPVGICQPYAWIAKPDEKYPPARYKGNIALDKNHPVTKEILDKIDELYAEAQVLLVEKFTEKPPKAKRGQPVPTAEEAAAEAMNDLPYWDSEDDSNTVIIQSSSKADRKNKTTGEVKRVTIRVVDSKGKPITNPPIINGGSKVKFKISIRGYADTGIGGGVTIDLESVMIVELVAYSGGSNEWGDEAVDGGFTADDVPQETKGNKPDDSDNSGSNVPFDDSDDTDF
ncbi:MAG: hypothetical protein [Caudoviricetes sp.]|nr:MAG: hypothetical protein [Caudoviricetes sp.]